MEEPKITDDFHVLLLGIIFDPEKRKIFVIRKEGDPELGEKFTWGFPGTELFKGKQPADFLVEKLKEKTGYDVENLGAVFSKVYPENDKLLAIYYLCEVKSGEQKMGQYYKEMQWIDPEEIEKKFTTSFHPMLKEYIINLK